MTTLDIRGATNASEYHKVPRAELVRRLIERDGTRCQHPDADHELDFTATDGPTEVTVDHWFPQYWCKAEGWTMDQIWDLSNLKLMCKKHNAAKGDLIPNSDGTLPEKKASRFRYRRQKRANRPDEPCVACDNGHNLLIGEVCAQCNCNAQRFPRWAKIRTADCDHEIMWCIWCSLGVIERPNSIGIAMRQADSDELGEYFDDEAFKDED